MEIISLLHVYTVPWQLVFLKNFQPLLLYFLMSWYIYHILFIISSLTVFAEPHRIALSWHCFWGTQQKIEHIFSLLSRAEKKKQANGKLWNVTYSLLKWRGSIPFNFIFMCKFLLCSLSSLVLWVFPQALFVISSEMFIAETCLLLCNCVYPFCLIHVHTRKIKPWMFEM